MKNTEKQKLAEAARYANADVTGNEFWDELRGYLDEQPTDKKNLTVERRPLRDANPLVKHNDSMEL